MDKHKFITKYEKDMKNRIFHKWRNTGLLNGFTYDPEAIKMALLLENQEKVFTEFEKNGHAKEYCTKYPDYPYEWIKSIAYPLVVETFGRLVYSKLFHVTDSPTTQYNNDHHYIRTVQLPAVKMPIQFFGHEPYWIRQTAHDLYHWLSGQLESHRDGIICYVPFCSFDPCVPDPYTNIQRMSIMTRYNIVRNIQFYPNDVILNETLAEDAYIESKKVKP